MIVLSYLGRRKDKQKLPIPSLTYPSLPGPLPLPYFQCSLLPAQITAIWKEPWPVLLVPITSYPQFTSLPSSTPHTCLTHAKTMSQKVMSLSDWNFASISPASRIGPNLSASCSKLHSWFQSQLPWHLFPFLVSAKSELFPTPVTSVSVYKVPSRENAFLYL